MNSIVQRDGSGLRSAVGRSSKQKEGGPIREGQETSSRRNRKLRASPVGTFR
jgi:hypothetical protein